MMVGGYFLIGVMAVVEPTFNAIVIASWVVIDATMLAMITGKLKKLGLPVPDSVSKFIGS
jgi:hypothetical protein